MLDQEPSHHIETLLVSCLSLATRPCILNTAQFCTMASPYNEAAKYLLHGGGVLNAMLSLWCPDGPNLAFFTWVSPRIGVSLDTECFHFCAFYVSRGILWPEETFLWRQILGGVGSSCPPRNFGDTDWQRFTLTTGTGFGSRVTQF